MAILDLEDNLSFITFINLYLIISIDEIQLGKIFGPIKPIQQLTNQKKGILILNNEVIETSIIHAKAETSI